MSQLLAAGGRRLSGEVTIQGAKNSVLPILAATLLTADTVVLRRCPRLKDVEASIRILEALGCTARWQGDALVVDTAGMNGCAIPDALMREMRSSVIFLGAILARCGQAALSSPGGCELGPRPIDLHLTGLRALGERCAQLPQVHLSSPKSAIGVDTEKCMLSGSVLGAAVLLDGITQRIEEELGRPVTLVVTGGLAKYVIPLCRHPLTYDPELLLKGLALLYQLNAPQHEHRHEPRNEGEHRRPGPRPAGRRPHSGSSPRRHGRSGRRPRRDDEAKAG